MEDFFQVRVRHGRDRMVVRLTTNYRCNQCLSPLKLWVWIPLMARCTWYNIMWWNLSVTCNRSVVYSGYYGLLHQY